MRWGVVTFPGSLDDQDTLFALEQVLGEAACSLWHKDRSLQGVDCVVLPGGFSYGDYLRPGAIARFSPVMESVSRFAREGGVVMGICNGFQILCEAGLLPGALIANDSLSFVCSRVSVRVEEARSSFTRVCSKGEVLSLPIKHGSGCFVADARTIESLEDNGQVALRYVDRSGRVTPESNPNGSMNNIAGILSREGNVFGLMPHPEHACERMVGGEDGAKFFRSIRSALSGGAVQSATPVLPGP
jgi:phosphoribosylformylglycinamidine synthase